MPATIELTEQQYRALFNTVTEFDVKASKRKGYNPYALGHYARGLSRIRQFVAVGATIRQAIVLCFLDRIRDCLLRSVGELDYVRWEETSYPRFHIQEDDDDE